MDADVPDPDLPSRPPLNPNSVLAMLDKPQTYDDIVTFSPNILNLRRKLGLEPEKADANTRSFDESGTTPTSDSGQQSEPCSENDKEKPRKPNGVRTTKKEVVKEISSDSDTTSELRKTKPAGSETEKKPNYSWNLQKSGSQKSETGYEGDSDGGSSIAATTGTQAGDGEPSSGSKKRKKRRKKNWGTSRKKIRDDNEELERRKRIFAGIVVWAFYTDGEPYTARIVKINQGGTYGVHFNDGDTLLKASIDDIRLSEEWEEEPDWEKMEEHDETCDTCREFARKYPRNQHQGIL